jgi:hypothetical protein
MNINLATYSVFGSNGAIDHAATLEKFTADLARFVTAQEAEFATISGEVHALFDRFPGARLNTDYIVNETLRALNVQKDNYTALQSKVKEYLKSNSQGKEGERIDSVFVTGRGKGGGVRRRRDIPLGSDQE